MAKHSNKKLVSKENMRDAWHLVTRKENKDAIERLSALGRYVMVFALIGSVILAGGYQLNRDAMSIGIALVCFLGVLAACYMREVLKEARAHTGQQVTNLAHN